MYTRWFALFNTRLQPRVVAHACPAIRLHTRAARAGSLTTLSSAHQAYLELFRRYEKTQLSKMALLFPLRERAIHAVIDRL
eukprot:2874807-Rhodomonas_salina.1